MPSSTTNQSTQQSNLPINGIGGNGVAAGGMQSVDTSIQMNYGYYYPYNMSMMSSPMQMTNNPYMNPMASPMLMNQFAQFMNMMGTGMNMQGMQYSANSTNPANLGNPGNLYSSSYSSTTISANAPSTLQPSSTQTQSQVFILPIAFSLIGSNLKARNTLLQIIILAIVVSKKVIGFNTAL